MHTVHILEYAFPLNTKFFCYTILICVRMGFVCLSSSLPNLNMNWMLIHRKTKIRYMNSSLLIHITSLHYCTSIVTFFCAVITRERSIQLLIHTNTLYVCTYVM